MGVAIHYRGYLKDMSLVPTLVELAEKHAYAHGWDTNPVDERLGSLVRKTPNGLHQYEGPIRGIELLPNMDCEPVRFRVDGDRRLHESTKTQFAGAETHVQVVELLRKVESLFDDFEVIDEASYWETNDLVQLEAILTDHHEAILCQAGEIPGAHVQFRLPDGTILDIFHH